jgi:hypothetical protein
MPQTSPSSKLAAQRDSLLGYEIAQEKAVALGRLGRALEAALAALADFDRTRAAGRHCAAAASTVPSDPVRRRLVHEAGYALWCFIVQREACGLHDHRLIGRHYGVPAEVHNNTGVLRRTPPTPD